MQPTALDHIELFGPQTANFAEENKLNAENVLALLVDWGKGRKIRSHRMKPNYDDLVMAIRNRKATLFRRLYFYYGGCGGILFPFFFTFITKKASWRWTLGLFLSGVILGLCCYQNLVTSDEFELAACIYTDFMKRTKEQMKKIIRLGKTLLEEKD